MIGQSSSRSPPPIPPPEPDQVCNIRQLSKIANFSCQSTGPCKIVCADPLLARVESSPGSTSRIQRLLRQFINFSSDIFKRYIQDPSPTLARLLLSILECFVLKLLLAPVDPAFGIQGPASLSACAQLGLANLNNYHFLPPIDRRSQQAAHHAFHCIILFLHCSCRLQDRRRLAPCKANDPIAQFSFLAKTPFPDQP